MSASRAAGIMDLLETNTGTFPASGFCIIAEQYFDLMSLLMWVAEIIILLFLNERRSAA